MIDSSQDEKPTFLNPKIGLGTERSGSLKRVNLIEGFSRQGDFVLKRIPMDAFSFRRYYNDVHPEIQPEQQRNVDAASFAKGYDGYQKRVAMVFSSVGLPDLVVQSEYIVGKGENGKDFVYEVQPEVKDCMVLDISRYFGEVDTTWTGENLGFPVSANEELREKFKEKYEKSIVRFADLITTFCPDHIQTFIEQMRRFEKGHQKLIEETGKFLDLNARNLLLTRAGELRLIDIDNLASPDYSFDIAEENDSYRHFLNRVFQEIASREKT